MVESTSRPAYRITDMHQAERPRERLAQLGPQALSNAELIAILLRVGVPGENAVQVVANAVNGTVVDAHTRPSSKPLPGTKLISNRIPSGSSNKIE